MCATHMRGNAVQEEVAMDRALKKLAKAQSSSVKTSSKSSQHEVSGRYSSAHDSNTEIYSSATVSAHEEKTWRDPKTNTYYIWMIPN